MENIIVWIVLIILFTRFGKGVKNVKGQSQNQDKEKTSVPSSKMLQKKVQKPVVQSAGNRPAYRKEQKFRMQGKTLEGQEKKREFTFGDNNAPAAERLLEGDGIPPGRDMLKCSYCGAENLLPKGHKGAYSCYFCREIL